MGHDRCGMVDFLVPTTKNPMHTGEPRRKATEYRITGGRVINWRGQFVQCLQEGTMCYIASLRYCRLRSQPDKDHDELGTTQHLTPTHFGLRLACIMSTARSAPSSSASMRRRSYDTTSAANAAATCGRTRTP